MTIPRTEMRNPASTHMDRMNSEELARLVITANYDAVRAVEAAAPAIGQAIDAIAAAFRQGGRLFYVGAGTSGRLGVMDAAECPPTFGVPFEQVCGILCGGRDRMFRAGEASEDSYEDGCRDIRQQGAGACDVVVGISAAGNAAYVAGALETARDLGCTTVGVSCNPDTRVLRCAHIPILTDTGPEVLTGSTRLKAGTAHKIVLNALSTGAMAKTGKVYENMMINLAPSNIKLRSRVIRIVREILDCDEDRAVQRLDQAGWDIRKAVETAL